MRNIFVENLLVAARQDPDLYLLTADLGFKALEVFRDEFPDRFINVGAAEANMIGVAAGLALTGKKVCAYSIAPFVTLRCLEQIRNDICYHNLNVNLIGVGGGFSYGPQGFSHNTTEDLAIMRTLPNMVVLCPGNALEAELAVKAALNHPGPSYVRLGKASEQGCYDCLPKVDFTLGKGILIKDGYDLTIISIGNMIEVVLAVVRMLESNGRSVRLISMPCLKPLDEEIIIESAKKTKAIFTVEEHSLIGGIGGAVAEVILESNFSDVVFKRFALSDECHLALGSQQYLREQKGLCVKDIVLEILASFKK